MSIGALQEILANFQSHARQIHQRAGCEVWRFDFNDFVYDLFYYPADQQLIRRKLGGTDATQQFVTLQTLQKLGVPGPRVIANLKGFRMSGRTGDACIVVADPNAKSLEEVLVDGDRSFQFRKSIAAGLGELLIKLHRSRMAPTRLPLEAFEVRNNKVTFSPWSPILFGVVTAARLYELGHDARRCTSAAERLRFWKLFVDEAPEKKNPITPRAARRRASDASAGREPFERLTIDGWSGVMLKRCPSILDYAIASRHELTSTFWADSMSELLEGSGEKIHDSPRAGMVYFRSLKWGNQTLDVVVKRPTYRPGIRGWWQRVRPSRARRVWGKTWRMLEQGFACELPLLVMENKRSGNAIGPSQMVVFAQVKGPTMQQIDLDAMSVEPRSRLLQDCGRLLRRIELAAFTHADAKASNWIVYRHTDGRLEPILIDLDGVRFYPWRGLGIERFVRAMRTHHQIRERDLDAILVGYKSL